MQPPLVTVICLCYNHAEYVREAIDSVLKQTHAPVQLIVVDDASTDNSVAIIEEIVKENPVIEFISLKNNIGNCRAFNVGLAKAKGEFLIDLAADDLLLPHRIETGVRVLAQTGKEFGVHFSDAELISSSGQLLGLHSTRFPHASIPQGDIYKELISRYFICPPSMMFTRAVMNVLGGYDETLSYEDFDFWIRSSRFTQYVYSPMSLVKKRVLKSALASEQSKKFSKHSRTTYQVCEKILALNRTHDEQKALRNRILYEIRTNLTLLNIGVVIKFIVLLWKSFRKETSEES